MFYRIHQQRIHQPYYRLGVFRFTARCLQALVIDLAGFYFAQNTVYREFITVKTVDMFLQLRQTSKYGFDLDTRIDHGAQLVEGDDIEHIRHRYHQQLFFDIERDRQQIMAAGEIFRHQTHRFHVGRDAGKIHALLADSVGHDVAYHRLGDETQ